MKIIPLSEGTFTIDHSKLFIPFNPDADDLQQRNRGSLLVEIQPFVIITSKDILLLDTGLGFVNENGILQIHQHLIDHGISPSDVTKVLMLSFRYLLCAAAGAGFCVGERVAFLYT